MVIAILLTFFNFSNIERGLSYRILIMIIVIEMKNKMVENR